MRVTSIAHFRTAPGNYMEWPVSLDDGVDSPIPPSFNQRFHLSAALCSPASERVDRTAAVPTVWIAAAFDVPGPVDIDAATWAIEHFVKRHAALRSTFAADASGGSDPDIRRRVHSSDGVRVSRPRMDRERWFFDDAHALLAHVRSRLDASCHPSSTPSYLFAAVDRSDRSTILCGFDHAHVDAVSITVAVEELTALYEAHRSGMSVDLDPVGSFVDYCAEEAQTPVVSVSDPRIAAWSDFVASCGGGAPTFPMDLGVPRGENAPQATSVHPLASDAATRSFEQHCRRLGSGMFPAVAAAVAQSVASIGGPRRLPLLFPLHTRHEKQYVGALGWFTTNAPMTVTVGESFTETLLSAHSSFRAALPLATVPISRVLGALGDNFVQAREDVFMVSYIDYRALPGACLPDRRAHHISSVTTADDAQFWVSRTDEGLSLRARFPDTDLAQEVVEHFAAALAETVRATAAESRALSLTAPSA